MMQTLPSHPPLSCKNERKLCNQVSGVLLTYLLLWVVPMLPLLWGVDKS